MQRAGFEVRDVEKLREHYALTLRPWVANLRGALGRRGGMVGNAAPGSGGCTCRVRSTASPTGSSCIRRSG